MEYNQQKDREAHFQSLALQSPSVNQIHANGSIVKSKKATGTKSIGNSSQIKCKEDSVLMIDDKIMKDVEDRCSITSSLSSYQSCDNNNENNDSNENIVPSAANNNFINNGTHRRDKNESEVENVEEDEEPFEPNQEPIVEPVLLTTLQISPVVCSALSHLPLKLVQADAPF